MESIRLRALKTFHSSDYGRINAGEVFWSEPSYAKEMIKLNNAKLEEIEEPATRVAPIVTPDNNRMLEGPDSGKDPSTESEPDPLPQVQSGEPSESAEATDNGPARRSSASRPAPRSRKKT